MKNTKYCNKCGKTLPIDMFKFRHRKNKICRRSWCIDCENILGKKYDVNMTSIELYEYIKNIETCKICGRKLNWQNTKVSKNSPSLDRTNNENFIDITNIQIICHDCNSTKRDRTMEEFIEYCKVVVANYE